MIGKGTQRTFGSQGIPRTAAAWLLRHRSSQGARSKALPLASACVDRRAHPAMQSASRACFRSAVATHEARAGEVRVTPVAAPMTVTTMMHWIVLIPHVVDARPPEDRARKRGGRPDCVLPLRRPSVTTAPTDSMIVSMPRPAASAMPPLARPAVWNWFTRRGTDVQPSGRSSRIPPRDLLPRQR